MRRPKYLSPTSIDKFEELPEEFYLQYLADERPPKFPQTLPMSVGSAFDAFIKSYYHRHLFGENNDPKFSREAIFEEQVEPHNRDWAWHAGEYAFEAYRTSGAAVDLLVELQHAQGTPRFEFTLQADLFGVPLLGKPDVYFLNREGQPIVLEWKVNGFCANYNKSPAKGYVRVRDGWKFDRAKPSRGVGSAHKNAHVIKVDGILINVATTMEEVDKKWAAQLSTYAWLMGADVGSDFICAIDQLCCKPDGSKNCEVTQQFGSERTGPSIKLVEVQQPLIRVAEHRCKISKTFQESVRDRYINLWDIINDGEDWIFRDMPKEESQRRQGMLDQMHSAFESNDNNGPGTDELFREIMGR